VKATVAGLRGLRTPEEVAKLRGLTINQVLGLGGEQAEAATLPGLQTTIEPQTAIETEAQTAADAAVEEAPA
jgi:small subunit ribosomal protein S5